MDAALQTHAHRGAPDAHVSSTSTQETFLPFSLSTVYQTHLRGNNMWVNVKYSSQQPQNSDVEVFVRGVQVLALGTFVARSLRAAPTQHSADSSAHHIYTVEIIRSHSSHTAEPHQRRANHTPSAIQMFIGRVADGQVTSLACLGRALIISLTTEDLGAAARGHTCEARTALS